MIIPQISRGKFSNFMGKVVAVGIKHEYDEYFFWLRGKLKRMKAVGINKDLAALMGKAVLCDSGISFQVKLSDGTKQIYYRVHFKDVAAVMDAPDLAKVKAVTTGINRCPRCKSAGDRNILLDGAGYCPSCGLDQNGSTRPKNKRLSRREEEVYGMRYAKERRLQQLGSRRPKDKPERIMTFGKG